MRVFLASGPSSCRVHARLNTHACHYDRTCNSDLGVFTINTTCPPTVRSRHRDEDWRGLPYSLYNFRSHHVDYPIYKFDVYVPWDAVHFSCKAEALVFRGSITLIVNRHRFPRSRFPWTFVLRSDVLSRSTQESISIEPFLDIRCNMSQIKENGILSGKRRRVRFSIHSVNIRTAVEIGVL